MPVPHRRLDSLPCRALPVSSESGASMLRRLSVAMLLLATAHTAFAQSASEHIALGDREHAAMNATVALGHYEAAVAAEPQHYEALWKASREAIDLGEYEPDKEKRMALYAKGEEYARRAVAADPRDAEAHFALARALGRTALALGTRDRIKYAKEIREHALQAIEIDPDHGGALHVMGVWNAEVRRLSGIERFIAKNLLGGKVFGTANWEEAVRYMERAVAVDPTRLTHHLDLAKIYADVGDKAKARAAYELVVRAPALEYNDRFYKREAENALKEMN